MILTDLQPEQQKGQPKGEEKNDQPTADKKKDGE
jgi:hypothetical protein